MHLPLKKKKKNENKSAAKGIGVYTDRESSSDLQWRWTVEKKKLTGAVRLAARFREGTENRLDKALVSTGK